MEMPFRHLAYIQQSVPSVLVDQHGTLRIFNVEQLNLMGVNRDGHVIE